MAKRKKETPAFVTRRNAVGIGNRKPATITGPTPAKGFEKYNAEVKTVLHIKS
jgi:hypothetical protein